MKYSKIIMPILVMAAFIYFHNSIQFNLFSLGLSWTLSAIIPYILELIAAILLGLQFSQLLRDRSRTVQRMTLMSSVFVAGGIAFLFNPVYEGDFSNTYQEVVANVNGDPAIEKGLTMLALPGCPYCYERIGTLNFLRDRNPDLLISVILVQEDSMTMENYKSRLLQNIEVRYTEHGSFLAKIVGGSFPAFFYRDEQGQTRFWRQAGLGTTALDWIEKRY